MTTFQIWMTIHIIVMIVDFVAMYNMIDKDSQEESVRKDDIQWLLSSFVPVWNILLLVVMICYFVFVYEKGIVPNIISYFERNIYNDKDDK